VDDGAILNVDFVANPDKIYIAAHHGLKPHGALIAHGDFSNDGGVFSQKTVVAKLWRKIAAGKN